MRRFLLAASACCAIAAALAPGAAAAGGNVVTLRIAQVALPAQLPGSCRLTGRVEQVLAGQAFHKAQTLSIYVPCGRAERLTPIASRLSMPVAIQDVDVLRRSRLGIAHLDDSGALLWRPWTGGALNQISGYHVLDADAPLRATPI